MIRIRKEMYRIRKSKVLNFLSYLVHLLDFIL